MSNKIKTFLKPHIEKVPFLATSYRKMRDGWQIGREPQPTPNGFKLVGNLSMQAGNFEPQETKFFKELAADADVVINAGANIGYYCCHALAMDKHVVAFEPIALNVKYLLKNLKTNGWEDNVEIFPIAVTDKAGIVTIYGGGTGASLIPGWAGFSSRQSTMIPASSLDLVLGHRFDGRKVFILIDIEGVEYQLLQGAKNLLVADPKPTWMVEIDISQNMPDHEKNPTFLTTFELFWSYGYDSYAIGERLIPFGRKQVEDLIANRITLESPNFVFKYKH